MEYRTRKIIKPGDLNPRNTLFGGRLMEWVDEECYIFASCQLENQNLVTKFIGEVEFKSPARQGDVVEIGVAVIEFGNTSVTLRCDVRNKTTKQIICRIHKVVFVCIDESGRPCPHGKGLDEFHLHQAVS